MPRLKMQYFRRAMLVRHLTFRRVMVTCLKLGVIIVKSNVLIKYTNERTNERTQAYQWTNERA